MAARPTVTNHMVAIRSYAHKAQFIIFFSFVLGCGCLMLVSKQSHLFILFKEVFHMRTFLYSHKILAALLAAGVLGSSLAGCAQNSTAAASASQQTISASAASAGTNNTTSGFDCSFDEADGEIATQGTALNITEDTTETDENGVCSYTITAGGAYSLSGTVQDTLLIIDAGEENVTLILNGVTLQSTNSPAIYVRSAGKVTLTLAEGTENMISDGSGYTYTDGDTDVDAAIFSRADLVINGSGSLTVNGSTKHGIVSKDDLIVWSGSLTVTAVNAGLVGKDCVKVRDGQITITAGTDGIRSDNDSKENKGFIYLQSGTFTIAAGNDGIQAETLLQVENANITITAGGGANAEAAGDESCKGLKSGSGMVLLGGSYFIDSYDDAVHSNGDITITGGSFMLSTGDDGVHSDSALSISGDADITVAQSYEGLEAAHLIITGGIFSVTSRDDGLNAAGGSDGSAQGSDPFASSTGSIEITGGTFTIHAGGDGIDANGTVNISGGEITVIGPVQGDTSILDYDTVGTISGGTFIGLGSSMMPQNFGTESTQGAIMVATEETQSTGTLVQLTDESGTILISCVSEQEFNCLLLSCPEIAQGESYTLTVGDTETVITMDEIVYNDVSTSAGPGDMGGPGMGGQPGQEGGPRGDAPQGGQPPKMPQGMPGNDS